MIYPVVEHFCPQQLRLQAIKRCEEAIMNAIRYGDPNVIQAGCVTQWNLCLPLTQPNLRRQIRKPLTLIAEALEDIQRSVGMMSFRERFRESSCVCSLVVKGTVHLFQILLL